jgi:hypothetical protein
MLHVAVDHPLHTGAAETLLAGVPDTGTRHPQRRQGTLVRGDPHDLGAARQLQIERRSVDDRQRGEPLDMQFRARVERDSPTDDLEQRRRAARVYRGPSVDPGQEVVRGRQSVHVVGTDLHLVTERTQLLHERQAFQMTAGVAQRPGHTEPCGEADHRQDRGDTNTAGDETDLLRSRPGTG